MSVRVDVLYNVPTSPPPPSSPLHPILSFRACCTDLRQFNSPWFISTLKNYSAGILMHASVRVPLARVHHTHPRAPMFLISKLRGRIAQLKLLSLSQPSALVPPSPPHHPNPRYTARSHTVECFRETARKKKSRGTANPIAGIGSCGCTI